MAITETWLHNHKDGELHVDGFKFFHADRKRTKKSARGRFSGGVGCYVRSDLACTMEVMINFSNGVVELLGLYSKVRNLFIAVIYRQPDDSVGGHQSTDKELQVALDKLEHVISDLADPAPNVIFCGDFNIRNALWPGGSPTTKSSLSEKKLLQSVSNFTNKHFLSQHIINTPTHVDGGTLDLVFSNNQSLVHSYKTLVPLRSTSDHYVLEVKTPLFNNDINQEEEKPNFSSPFNNLNFFSNDIQWESICTEIKERTNVQNFLDLPPNEKLDKFMSILIDVCHKFVPTKRSARKAATQIPRDRRILMRKRRKLHIQMESATTQSKQSKIREKLVKVELLLIKSHSDARERKEQLAIKAIKTNPRYFFSYAKQFSLTKSKVGPLLDHNNEFTSSSSEMAAILSKQYSSVFSSPSTDSPVFSQLEDQQIPTLTDITFTEQDIVDAIDELSNTSSSGPDGLAAIFLKKCKLSLAKPLYSLWRDCLDKGVTPAKLKEAHIIPIHKGGSQGVAANYRPIALTSHLIKIFEKVMRNKIVSFFQDHDLFNDSQHGFTLGRSCLSQLLAFHDKILSVLEQGLNVDTVYLDFAKAFDKVDHRIVLKKLSILGIRGKVLAWIESFLLSRTQSVVVNGVVSPGAPVISGVPQGSVIGPLLFLVLISDIDADIALSFLSSFADDTRLSRAVAGVTDASALQTDMEAVYQWARDNNMTFNDLKFEMLRFGPDTTLKICTNYTSPYGAIINSKDHVKDLGVTVSADGTFKEHMNKICQSAKNMCAWILRTFKSRSPDLMLTTWKSLVLPILDYCSQLWCPQKKGDIQQIEEIQKSFTRKIPLPGREDYWKRLSSLRLYSLERRRERYRIIYIWKILEDMVPNFTVEKSQVKTTTSTRSGRLCVIPSISRTASTRVNSLREGSLCINGAQLFNLLPKRIRNMSGVELPEFKKELDSFLATIPDEPQSPGYTDARQAVSNSLVNMIPTIRQGLST